MAILAGIGRAEYLASERTSEVKREWRDGEIIDMPGVSKNHSRLQAQLGAHCVGVLRGTPCEYHPSDLKVRTDGSYSYPDGSIVCDPEFTDDDYVLLNPLVVFEILSPTTEAYDRGEKFRRYASIPSLRDYVLITADAPIVEVFSRADDGWTLRISQGLESTALLPAVNLSLPLAHLYERLDFGTSDVAT